MIPLSRLRHNPYFVSVFAHVHPFFWPVLWWSLNRLLRAYKTVGVEELMYSVNRRGIIRIVRLGDKRPDPSAYRRPDRIFRPLTDPSFETSLPAAIAASVHDELQPGQSPWRGRPLAPPLNAPAGAASSFDSS